MKGTRTYHEPMLASMGMPTAIIYLYMYGTYTYPVSTFTCVEQSPEYGKFQILDFPEYGKFLLKLVLSPNLEFVFFLSMNS